MLGNHLESFESLPKVQASKGQPGPSWLLIGLLVLKHAV
jgi:hypothetical protein